jgi:predicted aspartyl protease
MSPGFSAALAQADAVAVASATLSTADTKAAADTAVDSKTSVDSRTFADSRTGADSKAAAEDLKVDDIVKRALTAYGGRDALAALEANSTAYGKQTASDTGQTLVYRCERKGNKWRIDLDSSSDDSASGSTGGSDASGASGAGSAATGATGSGLTGSVAGAARASTSTAYDGVNAWQSVAGEVSNLSPDKLVWLDEQQQRQPTLLTRFQEKGYNFTLMGRTQFKQIPVYAIEIAKEGSSPTTLFLDQNNYLVVASSYDIDTISGDAKASAKLPVSIEYSEYRPTAGTLVPFKQVQYSNNKQVSQLELSSVNAATAVDEGLFNRPSNGTAYRVSRPVSVPFDYSQREIVMKGRINGSEELEFLLDTGASDTIIDRRVAAEHYLTKFGQYDIAAMSGMVTARSSSIKRMELGNLLMNDVPARILDLSAQSRQMGKPIAGIIGTNVISKFLVTLDYGKPAVIFADIDSTARPAKAAATAFTQKQAPFVKAIFNGKDEQVLLFDTGAAFNHIPPNVAQRYLGSDPANVRHSTEGTGLDGRPLQLGTVVVDSVSIAGLPARKVSFTFPSGAEAAKAAAAKSGGREGGFFQDSRLGILGNPFFQNFIVTIDYKFNRLLLQPNPSVKLHADIEQSLNFGDEKLVVRRDFRLAELAYQKAMMIADSSHDGKEQARLLGRLGNLRRVMAKDLSRPEHAKAAYDYFVKGQEKARSVHAQDVEGRILADWSLLYIDNGQLVEAKQTIDRALLLAPQDPNVNVDIAVHLYKQRLFPEAQKYIEKALFLDPNNWQALWYQVKLSENFYDTPRVVTTLKEILRFYPWSKTASDKLRGLTSSGAAAASGSTVAPANQGSQPQRTIVVPGH